MRVVGQPDRYSEVPSPQEAWRRGQALDAMLPKLDPGPAWPRVQRLSHAEMNRQDDERMLARARLINKPLPK